MYFLDTNAYAILLSGSPAGAEKNLKLRLDKGEYCEASISEISSLEIQSVLGKLSRAQSGGIHQCDRRVSAPPGDAACPHHWLQPQKKALRLGEINRLRKAISDAENARGSIRLFVQPLDASDYSKGRLFLSNYAAAWKFGSHDAIIAAAAQRHNAGSSILVTSDSSLKQLLKQINLAHYDPLKDEEWSQA